MNPFPGLRPFTQEEDYLFFGREEQTLELLQRLASNRFVAVVGTSGSGKSSLVRCGLLSELLGGRMLDAGASWEIAVTHPGGNPLALLSEALLDADLYDREAEHARENLLATLSRSHFGLVEAVKQAGLGVETNFLLVVDQFEEIFRFNEAGQRQQEAANEFVSLLLEAAAQKAVPIYIVLTMRSDFIGECGQFEGLAEMVNRGEFLIPRLSRDQFKRVIEGPIKVASGQIAPRLLQRLLNDLGQQADQLPCLQHALMRTWNVWAAKGDAEALDLDDYQRVGKMSQALSLHADEIYESLASDRQRELCQGMFQALTVEESNSRGIRRPQRLGRLCQILEVEPDELRPIIDAYRQRGVTFLMPSPEVELTEQTIVDISHESLMRVWTRLRQWVEEETQAAGIYHRLSESADLHAAGKAGMYRDPELGIALAWQESKRPNAAWAERYRLGFGRAISFLEASQRASVAEEQVREAARQRELEQAQQLAEAQQLRLAQQQLAAGRLRKLIAGLAVVAVIAGVACVIALFANRRANRLAENARQNEEQAKLSAQRAEESRQETAIALGKVESQKTEIQESLSKAEVAERQARAAEEAGRKLLYTTDMRLAPFVWRDDRATGEQLRTLLAKHVPDQAAAEERPDLRGFEWNYYQNLFERSAEVFSGHEATVNSAAFTADGPLVTLDNSGQVRRWDVDLEAEDEPSRRDLPDGASAWLRTLSPNGKLVALAAGDKLQVFDSATGIEQYQINLGKNSHRRVAFSGDSAWLVIVDDKIRWFTARGEAVASFDQKFDRIESIALSSDGLTLAVVGHSSVASMFSTYRLDTSAKKVNRLAKDIQRGGTLHASALSPDGQRLVVSAKLAASLYTYDANTGRAIAYDSSAHACPIAAIAFSADGAKLATGDEKGTIQVWDDVQSLTAKGRFALKGHLGTITSIGFSSDGQRLVSTSEDRSARAWDLANSRTAIRRLELVSSGNTQVSRVSSDGLLIAVADSGGVRLWDATSGKIVRELAAITSGRVYSVAFSPTDRRLLAVGYGGAADVSHVVLWDIDAATELARLPGATDLPDFTLNETNALVGALAFSPDGKYLAAGFGSKNMLVPPGQQTPLKVWDVATRRLIHRLSGHTGYCVSLDFSRDGKFLASGSRDGTAIVWSTSTWKAAQTLKNPDQDSVFSNPGQVAMVECVAFSPDSKMLALANREGTVQLWDVASGQLVESLKGHSSCVSAVAFSPDGRTLASGGTDETVRLWNVETRRELMQLDQGEQNVGQVRSLAFSPDGRHLLADYVFWSAAPPLWNDVDQAARQLQLLLDSNADFQSRIRMLSENLRLHEALAKLDSQDPRVAAALAAAQANWHASRNDGPNAAAALGRLIAADPKSPDAWLRTPGLLRLATALLRQDRPRDAAALLTGGARRRDVDGLAAVTDRATLGFYYSNAGSQLVVIRLRPGTHAARSGLQVGDVIEKLNDTPLTEETRRDFSELVLGDHGAKVRLTVRRPGSDQPKEIELMREQFVTDETAGKLLLSLQVALNERLADEPGHPGLLELRAELAGQWSGTQAQLADYTAAIEALAQQTTEEAANDLRRLHGRRGIALVRLEKWPEAVADFAKAVTANTTHEELLVDQAKAQANVLLAAESGADWKVLQPVEMKSEGRATLTLQPDGSILASGTNPQRDVYTLLARTDLGQITAIRLEALPDPSLPRNGPGRDRVDGNFHLNKFRLFSAGQSVPLSDIIVVHQNIIGSTPTPFATVIEGELDNNPGWGNYPRSGQSNTATMGTRLSRAADDELRIEMHFSRANWLQQNLGRFRLSVSSRPDALDRERKYFAAMRLTDPWQKLVAAYLLQGNQQAIDQLLEQRPKLAGLIGDVFIDGEHKDWSRAVKIYSQGITAESMDASLLSKRARAYEGLANWDAAAADWSRAAEKNPDGARLLAEFAGRLATAGQTPLARTHLDKVQGIYEQSLQTHPDDNALAMELAQVLLTRHQADHPHQHIDAKTARWITLEPTEMKSAGGSRFDLQPDGSILVSGNQAALETYTLVAPAPAGDITSLRLEAIPHPSLPIKSSGRADANGNAALAEWTTEILPPQGATPVRVVWTDAESDLETPAAKHYRNLHIHARNCIDGNLATYWETWPQSTKPHYVILRSAAPIATAAGSELRFTMRFGVPTHHGLGSFRLSISGDLAPLDRSAGQAVADVKRTSDPWLKLAGAYALQGRTEEAVQHISKALELAERDEARKQVLQIAALFDEVFAVLARRQPDDSQLQLALVRNLSSRGKAALAADKPADALAGLTRAQSIVNRLLPSGSVWQVLTPVEMKTESGGKIELEKDGSVFVPQAASTDVYSLVFQTELKGIKGLRLEALADSRLPKGGPGWNSRAGYEGNFVLSELSLEAALANKPDSPRAVALRNPAADFSEENWNVRQTVDGKLENGWGVHPEYNKDHVAVFDTAEAIGDGKLLRLTVRLNQKYNFPNHVLGRFRLSFTNDAATLLATRARLDFKDSELVDLYVSLGKANDKQGKRNEAVASFAQALSLASDRADKARIIDEAAPLSGMLQMLAAHAAADGQFQAALTRHYMEQRNAALADDARKKGTALYEARLAKEPENSVVAGELAELLLDLPRLPWTVAKSVEISTNGVGAALALQPDGSVLASGENPSPQEYRLRLATELKTITAFRLEVLTDESLPRQGPGRGRTGNFAINWNFTASKPGDTIATALRINSAAADHSHSNHPISIGHWNIAGGEGKPHEGFLALETPWQNDAGSEITVSIKGPTGGQWADENLGRFRLSVTDDPLAFEHESRRLAAIKLTDPWLKLAAAYAMTGGAQQASQYFSAALTRADGYEARKPIVELALRFADLLPVLARLHPEEHQLQLALARKLVARGQEALAAKKPADGLLRLKQAQEVFARLLAPIHDWTVLTPLEMTTESGSKLELQKDGSVFVVQPAKNDVYSLVFQTELKRIAGLRLEALADSRLPGGGPGWSTDGNFVLSELSLQAFGAARPEQPRTIGLKSAAADVNQTGYDIPRAVDGNPGTGWAISPEFSKDHTAIFETAAEAADGTATRLVVRLRFGHNQERRLLGRFRLSFASDPKTLSAARIRLDLKDSELVDFYTTLGTAYARSGRPSDAAQAIVQAIQQAPNPAMRAALVEKAIADDVLRLATVEHRPDDHQLQLGYAAWLASQGRWDEAASAYQHAAKLNAEATPPWLQTGFWTVAAYPYGLAEVFPPESSPDPFKPVDAAPAPGQSVPDAHTWQPILPVNGRLDFGTAKACYYALTRIFSPVEQEVAFQMGDDDRMRLFVNDRLLFQNTAAGSYGLPKEHELAVTLEAGWNTVLLKVENTSGPCNAFLALSRDPQDIVAAGVGSRVYELQQLTAAGKADEAIAQLTEMLSKFPQNFRVVVARAEAYTKLSQWEPALDDWASADLYVPDKKQKYGNSPFYCLEQRARIFNQLKQYDKAALEYTELLKPERHGNVSWALYGRAGAYDRLRQWDLARADYDQAVKVVSANDKGTAHYNRVRHLALQGQWKQAAEDVLQAWQTPNFPKDWASWRDAALIFAIAGDMSNYKQAAAEVFALSAGNPNADQCRWTLTVMTVFPDMINSENRPRLLEMVSKCDNYWRPRHTSMTALRGGDYTKAGEWLAGNSNTAHLLFMRAANEQMLGNKDLAKKLFEEGNVKLREQQAKDPGAAVPQPTSWQDWIPVVLAQYEASSLILGSAVGPPRKLALEGHTLRAADAYLEALKEAADQDSRMRIVDELAQFNEIVTILHERLPADPSITAAYGQMVDRVAADYHKQLEALSPEKPADIATREKLVPAILARDGVLASLLKLRPDDTQLAMLHAVRIGDWNNAAAGIAKLTEENPKADSVAWMVPGLVWAYAGEHQRHREQCQKVFEKYRDWATANDAGRYLKVLLLVPSEDELPQDAVKKFTDAAATYGAWHPSLLAFVRCREGDYVEAHKQLDRAFAQDPKSFTAYMKAWALGVRALTYAKQQDVPQARKTLDELKQFLATDQKLRWNADGSLDGNSILSSAAISHDKLFPEVLRREAEQLLQLAPKVDPTK